MARFITTNAISQNLEQIILEARSNLILLSPYLKLSSKIAESLMIASNKGVRIQLIYGKGKEKLKAADRKALAVLRNLQLYYFEKLHAKCYFNEETMIITSMNMHEYSARNNSEFGLLINRKEDTQIFNDAFRESLSILGQLSPQHLGDLKQVEKRTIPDNSVKDLFGVTNPVSKKQGVCIGCGDPIPKNLKRPYCLECYHDFLDDEDFNEHELYCHTCGEISETTIYRPQCISCYKAAVQL